MHKIHAKLNYRRTPIATFAMRELYFLIFCQTLVFVCFFPQFSNCNSYCTRRVAGGISRFLFFVCSVKFRCQQIRFNSWNWNTPAVVSAQYGHFHCGACARVCVCNRMISEWLRRCIKAVYRVCVRVWAPKMSKRGEFQYWTSRSTLIISWMWMNVKCASTSFSISKASSVDES